MSDTEELLTGRAGNEAAQGYEPMLPADPVDKPDTLTPQDLAADDSAAQRHLSRPPEADFGELTERPYLNVKSGERVPENQVVSAEQAAHDLASVRAAEKLEREAQQNRDLQEALGLLETEQLVDRLAAQPAQPQPDPDLSLQPEQADPAQIQATIDEADKRVAEFLADPFVRERVEREFGQVQQQAAAQVEQAKATFQQATAQLAQEALATMAALVPEIQGMTLTRHVAPWRSWRNRTRNASRPCSNSWGDRRTFWPLISSKWHSSRRSSGNRRRLHSSGLRSSRMLGC